MPLSLTTGRQRGVLACLARKEPGNKSDIVHYVLTIYSIMGKHTIQGR